MVLLGIRLEPLARLRAAGGAARGPDLLAAAHAAMLGGADAVVARWRGPAGAISERDVRLLKEAGALPLRLEVAPTPEAAALAKAVRPAGVTVVADGAAGDAALALPAAGADAARFVEELRDAGVPVALSLEPDDAAIVAAGETGAEAVELHAGRYGAATVEGLRLREHRALAKAAVTARSLGLRVRAGHGLDVGNVARVVALPEVEEVTVGHDVAARAVFEGLRVAVAELRARVASARAEEAPLP